jgi:hypothetical protein
VSLKALLNIAVDQSETRYVLPLPPNHVVSASAHAALVQGFAHLRQQQQQQQEQQQGQQEQQQQGQTEEEKPILGSTSLVLAVWEKTIEQEEKKAEETRGNGTSVETPASFHLPCDQNKNESAMAISSSSPSSLKYVAGLLRSGHLQEFTGQTLLAHHQCHHTPTRSSRSSSSSSSSSSKVLRRPLASLSSSSPPALPLAATGGTGGTGGIGSGTGGGSGGGGSCRLTPASLGRWVDSSSEFDFAAEVVVKVQDVENPVEGSGSGSGSVVGGSGGDNGNMQFPLPLFSSPQKAENDKENGRATTSTTGTTSSNPSPDAGASAPLVCWDSWAPSHGRLLALRGIEEFGLFGCLDAAPAWAAKELGATLLPAPLAAFATAIATSTATTKTTATAAAAGAGAGAGSGADGSEASVFAADANNNHGAAIDSAPAAPAAAASWPPGWDCGCRGLPGDAVLGTWGVYKKYIRRAAAVYAAVAAAEPPAMAAGGGGAAGGGIKHAT